MRNDARKLKKYEKGLIRLVLRILIFFYLGCLLYPEVIEGLIRRDDGFEIVNKILVFSLAKARLSLCLLVQAGGLGALVIIYVLINSW